MTKSQVTEKPFDPVHTRDAHLDAIYDQCCQLAQLFSALKVLDPILAGHSADDPDWPTLRGALLGIHAATAKEFADLVKLTER